MQVQRVVKYGFLLLIIFAFLLYCFIEYKDFSEQKSIVIHQAIPKAEFDSANYEHITLRNGIEALIINRNNQQQSHILVGVKNGLINDPETMPGLSHLLEHIVGMGGSKNYPEPGELRKFIRKHGGVVKGIISELDTTYEIVIDDHYLDMAMSRLADSLHHPIFDNQTIRNEINAMDAEFWGHLQLEDYKLNRANYLTRQTDDPAFGLFQGNKNSLYQTATNTETIKSALIAHHNDFYFADNIKVVVITEKSVEEVRNLINKEFGVIKRGSSRVRSVISPVSNEKNAGPIRVTIKGDRKNVLAIKVPLKSQLNYPIFTSDSFSSSVIDKLFFERNRWSIRSKLESVGFVYSLGVFPLQKILSEDNFSSEMTVFMYLTDKGMAQEKDVLSMFFSHFQILNNETYIGEIYTAADKEAKSGLSPWKTIMPYGPLECLMYASAQDVTKKSLIRDRYGFVADIISAINVNHAKIFRFNEKGHFNIKSEFDGVEFSAERESIKIDPEIDLDAWVGSDKKPVRHGLPDMASTPKSPFRFNANAFFVEREPSSLDASFLKVNIDPLTSLYQYSDFIYLQIIKNLLGMDNLNVPLSCQRYQSCKLDFNDFGGVDIALEGSAEEAIDQLDYVMRVVEKLYQLNVDDQAIESALQDACTMDFLRLTGSLEAADRFVNAYKTNTIPLWSFYDQWQCSDVSVQDFKVFYNAYLKQIFVSINATSAVSEAEMNLFTQKIKAVVDNKSQGYFDNRNKPAILPAKLDLVAPVKSNGEVVVSALFAASKESRAVVLAKMMAPLLEAQYFYTMRSVHNIGYHVDVQFQLIDGTPALLLIAQSYTVKAKKIQQLNDKFTRDFVANLASNIPEDIQPLKKMVINQLNTYDDNNKPPRCIELNSCAEEQMAIVNTVSREDLISFAKDMFKP